MSNKQTPRPVLRGEFIGRPCKVVGSSNDSLVGIEGKIMDETRNTLKIHHDGKDKLILKKGSVFAIKIDNDTYEVKGEDIQKKPHERVLIR